MAAASAPPVSTNLSSATPTSKPISMYSNSSKLTLKAHQSSKELTSISRRQFLNGSLALVPLVISPPPPSQAKEIEVGSYLPKSPVDPSFVLFKATPKDTPALRAGNICIMLLID